MSATILKFDHSRIRQRREAERHPGKLLNLPLKHDIDLLWPLQMWIDMFNAAEQPPLWQPL